MLHRLRDLKWFFRFVELKVGEFGCGFEGFLKQEDISREGSSQLVRWRLGERLFEEVG